MIRLFGDLNYGGPSIGVNGDTPDIRSLGTEWNDTVTSIQIPAGTVITIYRNINYGGQSLVLNGDTPDLRTYKGPGKDGTWNDALSSLKIGLGSAVAPRLKDGTRYVECSPTGNIMLQGGATDAGKVKITRHDDGYYDALFLSANRVLSIQPDGSLQTRVSSVWSGYEQVQCATQPAPNKVSLLFRVDENGVCGGVALQIVEG